MHNLIIQPVIALMFLTLFVWCYMYFLRLKFVVTNKVDAQRLETPEQCNSIIPVYINKPSNNFKNLFEAPILFYVICILHLLTNQTDVITVYLAWAFVIGRILHSLLHCFSKNVMARFYVYFLSSLILWGMLIKFSYSVVVT